MKRIMNLYSGCVLAIFVRELAKAIPSDYFPLRKLRGIRLKTLIEREREREEGEGGGRAEGQGGGERDGRGATTVYRDRASGLIFF
jgi:hypothetical protein